MTEMTKTLRFPWCKNGVMSDDLTPDVLEAVKLFNQLSRVKEEVTILKAERKNLLLFLGMLISNHLALTLEFVQLSLFY